MPNPDKFEKLIDIYMAAVQLAEVMGMTELNVDEDIEQFVYTTLRTASDRIRHKAWQDQMGFRELVDIEWFNEDSKS